MESTKKQTVYWWLRLPWHQNLEGTDLGFAICKLALEVIAGSVDTRSWMSKEDVLQRAAK